LEKVEMLIQRVVKCPVLVTLVISLLVGAVFSGQCLSASESGDKAKVVQSVASNYIEAGARQLEKGYYVAAEQSLLRAKDYEKYLTASQLGRLNELLAVARTSGVERKQIERHIAAAEKLIANKEYLEAKAYLEAIKDSQHLTADERKLVTGKLGTLEKQLGRDSAPRAKVEPKKELLDATLTFAQSAQVREVRPITASVETRLSSTGNEDGYINVINRRRNILRSHTQAVVNDTVAKVQTLMSEDKFDQAHRALEEAQRLVSKNRLQLGEDAYLQYSTQLRLLGRNMAQQQENRQVEIEQQKRSEAVEAQRQYKGQMESDRAKRISELMNNARSFQKDQRYDEALGQLEAILAIEPLHNEALLLKQTLEDTVSFRRQLEIQKEAGRERFDILTRTEESMIPYANELTYPKNWREIVAKRKPDEAIGQDPVSAAVHKQLDEIVDLSELTAEMSFEEAIRVLRDSVDPALRIFVSWRDLYDNAEVDRMTPINMDAISAIPLGKGLELLLKSVSGGFVDIDYAVENGVVTIATKEELGSKLKTLVYDVTDLLGRPAEYFAQSPQDVSVDVETAGGQGIDIEDEYDQDQLEEMALERAQNLVMLLQETIEPESWYEVGGEGSIRVYDNKKLIVRQTQEVHKKVSELLDEMRRTLGHQVAIEARFLVVGENFLEDIGLDVDFVHKDLFSEGLVAGEMVEGSGPPVDNPFYDPSGNDDISNLPYLTDGPPEFEGDSYSDTGDIDNWLYQTVQTTTQVPGIITDPSKFIARQGSNRHTLPTDTKIPGNLVSLLAPGGDFGSFPGLNISASSTILDTLQASFLLRATQAHRDATSLTAPKVSVLSGESATLRVQRITWYPTEPEFDIEELGGEGFSP